MSKDSLPSSSSPSSWSWTLAIPGVLESVFKNLHNEDLFRVRLVCQSWAKEAGRIIGKRLNKTVWDLDQLETLRKFQICIDIAIPLKRLRLRMPASLNINQISSQSYSTVKSLFLECPPSLVPHFLLNIFPNVESLSLRVPYEFSDEDLVASSAVVWENETLPRLHNLKLFSCFEGAWSVLVDKLLEKADKLESIDAPVVEDSNVPTFIAKLCSSSLKRIRVSCEISVDLIFSTLNNHPIIFPLETIDLDLIDSDTVSKSDIKLLLMRFSSTLSQLRLGFRGTFEMNFPLGVPVKKLHTLGISNFVGSMEWRNLPHLKKLMLLHSSIEGIDASISSTPAYCNLEALGITGSKEKDDKFLVFFREIAEYLGPQLKSLELSEVWVQPLLPIVFTHLTQLNRLSLREFYFWSGSTDKDLCGTDSLSCRPPRVRNLGAPLSKSYQRMIALAKKSNQTRGPNITNLKDLQYLSIDGTISDVAFLHGIVQCEKLKELYLYFYDVGEMTRDSIVHLLVNAGLEHLTTVVLNGERINHLSFAHMS